jgi:hypothetical protein
MIEGLLFVAYTLSLKAAEQKREDRIGGERTMQNVILGAASCY